MSSGQMGLKCSAGLTPIAPPTAGDGRGFARRVPGAVDRHSERSTALCGHWQSTGTNNMGLTPLNRRRPAARGYVARPHTY